MPDVNSLSHATANADTAPTFTADQALVARYRFFATYNQWANMRLYAAAARLGADAYRADRGAFFGSVHGTLNHLLAADRLWLRRITGSGTAPDRLNAIIFDDLAELTLARQAEDARLIEFTSGMTPAHLLADVTTPNMNGTRFVQPLWTLLDHIFNHQTHHRGQVHTLLTGLLGSDGAPPLDLIAMQRELQIARTLEIGD